MGVSQAGGIQLVRLSIRLIFNFMFHVQFQVHVQVLASEFKFSNTYGKILAYFGANFSNFLHNHAGHFGTKYSV